MRREPARINEQTQYEELLELVRKTPQVAPETMPIESVVKLLEKWGENHADPTAGKKKNFWALIVGSLGGLAMVLATTTGDLLIQKALADPPNYCVMGIQEVTAAVDSGVDDPEVLESLFSGSCDSSDEIITSILAKQAAEE